MADETHPQPQMYALLIGIDCYLPNDLYSNLRGAVRDVTQMETEVSLVRRLKRASAASVKRKARSVLSKIPARSVPNWDKVD